MSLLTAVSLISLVLAVGLMARWATNRVDALGRPRGLPVLAVSGLVILAVVAAVPGAKRRVEERRLDKIASVLVGHKVDVHCQSTVAALVDGGAEAGYVWFKPDGTPEPETLIKRDQCRLIEEYRKGKQADPTLDHVMAVHVLTHEAMHMRGERDEAVTECQAIQRDAFTARALRATPEEALRLAKLYWRVVYPQMPADYVTRDCRPGGPLDESLDSSPWAG